MGLRVLLTIHGYFPCIITNIPQFHHFSIPIGAKPLGSIPSTVVTHLRSVLTNGMCVINLGLSVEEKAVEGVNLQIRRRWIKIVIKRVKYRTKRTCPVKSVADGYFTGDT